jgi:hypothetical protein
MRDKLGRSGPEHRTWADSVAAMTAAHTTPPPPSSASVSAALSALGAYAEIPSDTELKRQADAIGGEHVLAAVLANALYGVSIGAGMLAEGHMLAQCAGTREMTLARNQVLKASGAEGPGVIGMLHWQTGQVAHLLKGIDEKGGGPVIAVAAKAASALLSLLATCSVFDPTDERASQIPALLDSARADLDEALAAVNALPSAAAATAAALFNGTIPGL